MFGLNALLLPSQIGILEQIEIRSVQRAVSMYLCLKCLA